MEYKIGKITQRTRLDEEGNAVQWKIIPYTTADGDKGKVEIKQRLFTASKARAAVEEEVQEIQQLKA